MLAIIRFLCSLGTPSLVPTAALSLSLSLSSSIPQFISPHRDLNELQLWPGLNVSASMQLNAASASTQLNAASASASANMNGVFSAAANTSPHISVICCATAMKKGRPAVLPVEVK
jgi:hypothetical protein